MRSLIIVSLFLTTLAGCISADTDPPPTPTAPSHATSLEERFSAVPLSTNASLDDWYLLSVESGANGTVVGFEWTVPAGAYVPSRWSDRYQIIVAEFAPIFDNGTVPSDWVLYGFKSTEDGLVPVFTILAPTYQVNSKLSLLKTEGTAPARAEPFFATLAFDWDGNDSPFVEEGETLYLAFAATSAEPAEVGLGFRLLDKDPMFETKPAEDTDSFLAARTSPPLAPPRTGDGTGLQVGLYSDLNIGFLTPVGLIGFEAWTDAVEMEERFPVDPRPHVSVRDLTLRAPYESTTGWSEAYGTYWASDALGTWSVDADVRGETVEANSLIVEQSAAWPASLATWLLLGMPFFGLMGEGAGASDASYDVDVASTNGFEVLFYEKVDLGVTLEDLFGVPSATGAFAYTGLLGDVPPQETLLFTVGDTVHVRDHTGRVMALPSQIA